MKDEDSSLQGRIDRERASWNTDDLVVAQHAFKTRIMGAFRNPHIRKTEAEFDLVLQQRCVGAAVLDYGCFDGRETERFLRFGASFVHGLDISPMAIERAKATIVDPRIQFHEGDAHALPFEDSSFDLIVGRAILHHLDLTIAFGEIARVLRPGGWAMFIEPLRGNPLAKAVRMLTPEARTRDERPLDRRDLRLGDQIIGAGDHRYSGVLSAPLGAASSLCHLSSDSWVMQLASIGDDAVAKTPLKYWGRIVYLSFKKS